MRTLEKALSYGPAVAVPLAWGIVYGTMRGVVDASFVMVPMLVVMLAAQLLFLFIGWSDMDMGVLNAWRYVILAGLPFTFLGLSGSYLGFTTMQALSIAYWMKAPGIGMAYVWEADGTAEYLLLGGISVLAGCLFDAYLLRGGVVSTFVLVAGTVQTVGIVKAQGI